MKREIKQFLALTIMSILIWGSAMTVFAAETDTARDSAGNAFAAGETVNVDGGVYFGCFAAGSDLTVSGASTEDDIAMAGMNVNMDKCQVASTAYLAGYNIYVTESSMGGNIVTAGYKISIDSKSESHAVIATGNEIEFSGKTGALTASANKVVINGTVDGDVIVSASVVEIGPNAVINGELEVTSVSEPLVPSTAKVASINYEKMVDTGDGYNAEPTMADKALDWIKSLLYWIVAMTLIGLLMCWLIRPQIDDAADKFMKRPAMLFGTGAVTFIALPLAAIICMITIVGIPLAFVSLIIYGLVLFTAAAFTGASLGKLVFKGMHRLPASLIGIVAIEVLLKIPFLGAIVNIACMLFALGYLIQMLWDARTTKQKENKDITEVIAEIPMVSDEEVTE